MHQKDFWEIPKKRREPWHPVIQAFVQPKIEQIKAVLSQNGEDLCHLSLLDVGCGNGFFSYYFEKLLTTICIDYSNFMLLLNPCEKKICASATKLPFVDNSFDIVFCSNLLHHLEKPLLAVEEMRRVSRKYVVLSEPNANNPLMFLNSLTVKEERGALKFSSTYLMDIALSSKLTVISLDSMGIVLPNKTPEVLLPLLKLLDGKLPIGFYNMVIASK